MAHTNNWDETAPTDETLATSIDDEIVKLRLDTRERFATDHKVASSDDGSAVYGVHKQVTFEQRIAQPTEPTGSIATLYLKTGDKDSEIRFTDENSVDNLIVMVGEVKMILGETVPDGWLALNGDSIGSATSGADQADNNLLDLYTYLWTELLDDQFAIAGGRGGSAAEDWGNNKAGTMPDARSRMPIGAGTGAGLTERVIGNTGGAESVNLQHAHTNSNHTHTVSGTLTASGTADLKDSPNTVVADGGDSNKLKATGGAAAANNQPVPTNAFSATSGNPSVLTMNNQLSTTQTVMNPWIALTFIIKY